jgi:hypothetical protein
MVSVEQIPIFQQPSKKLTGESGLAARRFPSVLSRSRAMAEQSDVQLNQGLVLPLPARPLGVKTRHRGPFLTHGN